MYIFLLDEDVVGDGDLIDYSFFFFCFEDFDVVQLLDYEDGDDDGVIYMFFIGDVFNFYDFIFIEVQDVFEVE